MPHFNYIFEELPLIVQDGFGTAEVYGCAEIAYSVDGSWCVNAIFLDGTKRVELTELEKVAERLKGLPRTHRIEHTLIYVNKQTQIFVAIKHRLECAWSSRVQDAVREQIENDREAEIDAAADRKMDLRREERAFV